MKRTKATHSAPAYPSVQKVLLEPAAVVGLLVLMAGAPVLQGCPFDGVIGHVDGDIEAPRVHVEVLLPDGEERALFMDDGGYVAYRIIAQVNDQGLVDFLEDTPVERLEEVDEVLNRHSVWELAPGEDLSAVEAEIARALSAAWLGRDSSWAFDELILSIEAWDSGEIDGDMPDTGL